MTAEQPESGGRASAARGELLVALPLLQAMTGTGEGPSFSLVEGTLFAAGRALPAVPATLSARGYHARVERLGRRLGLPAIDVWTIERLWWDELRARPDVPQRRLVALAHDRFAPAAGSDATVQRWRAALQERLLARCPHLPLDERFGPTDSAEHRKEVLEIGPVLSDWPRRLLHDREYATAESPFDDVRPLPLDDVWVDLYFLDRNESEHVQLNGPLHEAMERRYQERQGAAVAPEFVVERLHRCVALVGDPGIGKTTFLKWVARQLVRNPDGKYLLPLFVPLRRYVLSGQEVSLLQFAVGQCGVLDRDQRALWAAVLGHLAGEARDTVLLLLDGWDEVPADRRDGLVQQIKDLAEGFTGPVISFVSGRQVRSLQVTLRAVEGVPRTRWRSD